MSGIFRRFFPYFSTRDELQASEKALSGEIFAIKQAVLDEQGHTDKNFNIILAKIGQLEAQIKDIGAKSAHSAPSKGILVDFNIFAKLAVQNYEDLAGERAKRIDFEKKLAEMSRELKAISTKLNSVNSTQLSQPTEVNSTKLNSTKLNWNRGMTGMTKSTDSDNNFVMPEFTPLKESKVTQGHLSVLFALYNVQADIAGRAVSVKTLVSEIYGKSAGHSKESFVSRIVRELDKLGLITKGPRGRTTRVYLSKEGVCFCKKFVLDRKEAAE